MKKCMASKADTKLLEMLYIYTRIFAMLSILDIQDIKFTHISLRMKKNKQTNKT